MAVQKVNIEAFIKLAHEYPVIDVRSPAEFEHAHIPGAYSLPLFTNGERKVVGTIYKQESREAAIKKGLEYFGVKMRGMVEEVEKLFAEKKLTDEGFQMTAEETMADKKKLTGEKKVFAKTVLVHCWRGGMRSAGVAWLLDLYGFKVYTLVGGYKVFRQWVLQQFEKEYPFKILGGYTGSGKTAVLSEMKKIGANVIDLEKLAHHKGSAFGGINMPAQPSQEMFENKLAVVLQRIDDRCRMTDGRRTDDRCRMTDDGKRDDRCQMTDNGKTTNTDSSPSTVNCQPSTSLPEDDKKSTAAGSSLSTVNCQPSTSPQPSTLIWLEDESRRIGNLNIPGLLWDQIRKKPVIFLQVPFEERLHYILQNYGKCDRDKLIDAVDRIKKRLGGIETKTAINFLLEDNLRESFRVLLKYYDKLYLKGLQTRENLTELVNEIDCETVDAIANAKKILNVTKETIDA